MQIPEECHFKGAQCPNHISATDHMPMRNSETMSSELLFARNHLYHGLCPRALRQNQPLEKNHQKNHEG